jgi:hypothetical protein
MSFSSLQNAVETQVDLAAHHPEETVQVLAFQAQPLGEKPPRPFRQRVARTLEPAGGGGAGDTEHLADPIDREAFHHVHLEELALLLGQARQRAFEGGLEVAAAARLERGELRVERVVGSATSAFGAPEAQALAR